MTDNLKHWLAFAVAYHLPRADALLVIDCCIREPERMVAYISAGSGESYTTRSFARFALQCAKRVAAGPAA